MDLVNMSDMHAAGSEYGDPLVVPAETFLCENKWIR